MRALGGLHVIGTQLHESRRVDNQVRPRQGPRHARGRFGEDARPRCPAGTCVSAGQGPQGAHVDSRGRPSAPTLLSLCVPTLFAY